MGNHGWSRGCQVRWRNERCKSILWKSCCARIQRQVLYLHLCIVNTSGDDTHKEWQTTFTEILNELQKYVRKHFPQGIKWNSSGLPADTFIGQSPSLSPAPLAAPTSPGPSAGGAPPPPPPPPPPPAPDSLMPPTAMPASADKGSSMGAVFSQLNQGEKITSSLKHVDKSQMTHKNPSLREKKASPNPPVKPASLRRNASGSSTTTTTSTNNNKLTGKKTLEGVKWVIVYISIFMVNVRKTLMANHNPLPLRKTRRIFQIQS
jgi:hypothetical protein